MGAAESLAGRVLAEKYLLIERLGEGGFGSIWRAEHRVLRSPVAVKLIDLDMARKDGAVERFLREAQATAALRSPHVVQVLDYGVDGDQPFIVMELLEGENLAERIARVGPLSASEAARIVTHVARAIGKAHELGIVHRDLKPENIFLVNNGDDEVAKVLDFGVAKFAVPVDIQQNTYTITGSLIGTPYYMSPEQAQGNKAVDHRSDLWALGVITFEMLTGRRPFDGDALGDLVLTICVRTIAVPSAVASVPPGFDAWFARSVERDPNARFQSAREMALALLRVVQGESVEEGEGDGADGELRSLSLDARPSLRSSIPEMEPAVDIPSRPRAAAFAATVRDDTLANAMLHGSAPGSPGFQEIPGSHPSAAASPFAPSGPAATNFGALESAEDSEEHLTPSSVFGIAVLALAAGAAAVYGAFSLLRAHDDANDPVEPIPSASTSAAAVPTSSSPSKRRYEGTTTGKPGWEGQPGKPTRSTAEPPQSRDKSTEGPNRAGPEVQIPTAPLTESPVPSSPLPLVPTDPVVPALPPAQPPLAGPPENLTPAPPSPAPTAAPAPPETAAPQSEVLAPELPSSAIGFEPLPAAP